MTDLVIGILETAGQQGVILSLVALSVALSFRVLDFPDLTVDGSFALGGAVTAAIITAGYGPVPATIFAVVLGAAAGALTGFLNAWMKISRILAGILVMTLLYTVNLRVMGRPNLSLLNKSTLLTPFEAVNWPRHAAVIGFCLVITLAIKFLLDLVFKTNYGLLLLATGNNERAAVSAGSNPGMLRVTGLAVANAMTALAGSILAQSFGFADIGMGVGIIVIGFASLLIGEALVSPKTIFRLTLAAVIGSVVYQIITGAGLRMGLAPTDLKLATSVMVIIVLSLQSMRNRRFALEGNG